jgi:hypothetical protein
MSSWRNTSTPLTPLVTGTSSEATAWPIIGPPSTSWQACVRAMGAPAHSSTCDIGVPSGTR